MKHADPKEILLSGEYTCVLVAGEQIFSSRQRGVKPLVQFLQQGCIPPQAHGADKVVGKATAYLYVLLQVRALYAQVISKPALAVLQDHGIFVQYRTLTENIINRTGDGICPFEQAVLEVCDPQSAYHAILQKMDAMHITLEDTP